jgi:hypothetical protein
MEKRLVVKRISTVEKQTKAGTDTVATAVFQTDGGSPTITVTITASPQRLQEILQELKATHVGEEVYITLKGVE